MAARFGGKGKCDSLEKIFLKQFLRQRQQNIEVTTEFLLAGHLRGHTAFMLMNLTLTRKKVVFSLYGALETSERHY